MVLLLTCVVKCTARTPTPRLCPAVLWPVHWAPSRTTRLLVLAGARRWNAREKKNASSAFRLSLIYILDITVCMESMEHVLRRWFPIHDFPTTRCVMHFSLVRDKPVKNGDVHSSMRYCWFTLSAKPIVLKLHLNGKWWKWWKQVINSSQYNNKMRNTSDGKNKVIHNNLWIVSKRVNNIRL